MLSTLEAAGTVAAVSIAAFAALTFVWKLMGSPTPLSPENLTKPLRLVKRKLDAHRVAVAEKQATKAEQIKRRERTIAFQSLETSVNRLRCMEQRKGSFVSSEWKRQVAACKEDALRVLGLIGVRIVSDSAHLGPSIINCEAGSIIVDWGPSRWNRGQVQIAVYWHSNPRFTRTDFMNSYFFDGTIEHVKVLSRPLTESDMRAIGWEYFSGWRDGDEN